MDFLIDAWAAYLGPFLRPYLDSLLLWQGVSLVLLTLLVGAVAFRKVLA